MDVAQMELEKLSVVEDVDYLQNSLVLSLKDKKLKLIANFNNIALIQQKTGLGEIELISKFMHSKFSITDIATIIFCGIDDKDVRFCSISEVGDAILKSGKYNEYAAAAVAFLSLAMSDGSKSVGK